MMELKSKSLAQERFGAFAATYATSRPMPRAAASPGWSNWLRRTTSTMCANSWSNPPACWGLVENISPDASMSAAKHVGNLLLDVAAPGSVRPTVRSVQGKCISGSPIRIVAPYLILSHSHKSW